MAIVLDEAVTKVCEAQISREASHWSTKFPFKNVAREDLYQEGWVTCLSILERFDDSRGATLATYLTTCLRNRFRDLLDRSQRRRGFNVDGLDGLLQNSSSHPALSTRPSADLSAQIATLTPSEHEMAVWLCNEGGSAAAVARTKGITVEMVNRFKSALRKKL